MIRITNHQTADSTGGGYCSCCGASIPDGEIFLMSYGSPRSSTSFRFCKACALEMIKGLQAALEVKMTNPANGETVGSFTIAP